MKILVFQAIWCSDCRVMKPMWRNLKLQFPKLIIIENNYSDCDIPEKIQKYRIHDLPTIIYLDKEEKELERTTGIQHRDSIIDLINKYKNL